MRLAVLAVMFITTVACGDPDRAAPILVRATALPDTDLGVADPDDPLAGALAQTGTRPTVALFFSERLDGDAVEAVITDPETGAVRALEGRDGIVRIAPADDSVVGETITYVPADRAIRVQPSAHLPATTAVLVHVMAERLWDAEGNVISAAQHDGEPVLDIDGRAIAATVAFETGPIALISVAVPAFGTDDDPDTVEDETIPYDAPIVLEMNTALAPATVVAHITATSGETTPVAAAAGDDPAHLLLVPIVPLTAATSYELRIDAATDPYGVDWTELPRLFPFSTL